MRDLHFLFLICPYLLIGATDQRPRMLTEAEARRLVYEALPQGEKKLRGLDIAADSETQGGRTLAFEILWANPGPGSVHVDFYTVDRQTGALWRGVVCELVVTPKVSRMQRALRKRLGITESQYEKAADRNLCLE